MNSIYSLTIEHNDRRLMSVPYEFNEDIRIVIEKVNRDYLVVSEWKKVGIRHTTNQNGYTYTLIREHIR